MMKRSTGYTGLKKRVLNSIHSLFNNLFCFNIEIEEIKLSFNEITERIKFINRILNYLIENKMNKSLLFSLSLDETTVDRKKNMYICLILDGCMFY